jgi:hypothetical protein
MAQQFPCDICQQEYAIQMLTNMDSGEVISMGPSCLGMFYGHSALAAMGAGEHKGPATKCQACRRFHERMTTPVAPIGDVSRETSDDDHADMHSETVEGAP